MSELKALITQAKQKKIKMSNIIFIPTNVTIEIEMIVNIE